MDSQTLVSFEEKERQKKNRTIDCGEEKVLQCTPIYPQYRTRNGKGIRVSCKNTFSPSQREGCLGRLRKKQRGNHSIIYKGGVSISKYLT